MKLLRSCIRTISISKKKLTCNSVVASLTQPVIVLPKDGENAQELSARTPVVYLIGSWNNVAMYANTLTSTTIISDEHAKPITLGRTYSSMFNAQ